MRVVSVLVVSNPALGRSVKAVFWRVSCFGRANLGPRSVGRCFGRKLFLQEYFPLPEPTFVTHIDCLSTILTWMCKAREINSRGSMTHSGGWRLDYESWGAHDSVWRLEAGLQKFLSNFILHSNSQKKKSSEKKYFFFRKRLRKNCLSEKKRLGQKTDKLKLGFDILLCFPFCEWVHCVSRLSIKLFLPAMFTRPQARSPLTSMLTFFSASCVLCECLTGTSQH